MNRSSFYPTFVLTFLARTSSRSTIVCIIPMQLSQAGFSSVHIPGSIISASTIICASAQLLFFLVGFGTPMHYQSCIIGPNCQKKGGITEVRAPLHYALYTSNICCLMHGFSYSPGTVSYTHLTLPTIYSV